MRIRYQLVLLVIILFEVFSCSNSKVDLYNYDFFGIKMSNSYSEVINILKNSNKVFKEIINYPLENYVSIVPKDQVLEPEGENLDYVIETYKGKIYKYIKFEIDHQYLDQLMKIFGKKYIQDSSNYEWNIGDFNIIIFDPLKSIFSIEIINMKIEKQLIEDGSKDYKPPGQ